MQTSDLLRHQIIKSLIAPHTEKYAAASTSVWEQMSIQVISIVGVGGFNSLYARSIFLTQKSFPWLADCPLSAKAGQCFVELEKCFEGQTAEQSIAANLRQNVADVRENTANLREDTADFRERYADLREEHTSSREESASSREEKIQIAEKIHAISDAHMLVLQQVNERLVIATIEAQILAEQLQTAHAQLENAKAVAEKANLAKSDFLSSMSHELRTPLNAILGFAQLLEAGSPTPTPSQAARLGQITKAGWYLLELINEILDLSVIESGKLTLLLEPVSLLEVIHECHTLIEELAKNHGIRINYLPFDLGWFVHVDRTRLKQVMINLLSNAIKYNRANGTVDVACSLITPQRIRISIKDSGAGLSEEMQSQLFQPFNRLGQEAGKEEGTGIGLVVTKQLVELMDGTIGVNSTVGVGSEFWIELNADTMPHPAATHTLPEESAPQVQKNTASYTLLYVEDNPANLMLVEQIIARHPHIRMLSACDGNQGIELAHTHLPDVILMDINLPGISGIQALKILRKNPVTMHIPVIALSANAMPQNIETGMKAGFFRYLTKPIKINEIMLALNDALQFSKTGLVDTKETKPK